MAADFGERFTARDEFAQYRQEEVLAEPANWRLRFEIERVTDDVAVEFVHDDPEMAICIEAGATFFDCRDLEGEPVPLGLFRGDREKQHQVTIGTRYPHADRDGALLASLPLAFSCFSMPEIRIAKTAAVWMSS